jgi:hypothetical protein
VLDYLNPKCSAKTNDCSNKTAVSPLKYLICPNSNNNCGPYKEFKVTTESPVTLETAPLGYTEYCDYRFSSNSFNFSKAIYIEIDTQYLADVTLFINQST